MLLGPTALPRPGPDFGLRDTSLCSGSSVGNSALQSSNGTWKEEPKFGGRSTLLEVRYACSISVLSTSDQGLVHAWESLAPSLLWELFHFSPLTALYSDALGDMGKLGLNPHSKPGKTVIWAQVCPLSIWRVLK